MSAFDEDSLSLTRDDFADREGWLRHCHGGGVDLAAHGEEFAGVSGPGPYALLLGGIYGHTRRQYQQAWEGWGTTNGVDFRQLSKAYRAVAFANCLGLVMDTSVDITWSTVGITSDVLVAAKQKEFLDALRRWLARNNRWAAFLWVLERGDRFGLHTHMLMHLPEGLVEPFKAYAARTLARIVNQELLATPDSKTMLIQPRHGTATTAQWIRFRYMMKGINPRIGWQHDAYAGGHFSVAQRAYLTPRNQGWVKVKRLGVSRALDSSSFDRWRALNAFPDMSISKDGPPLYDDRFLGWHYANRESIREPRETRNGNAE